ncbi:hypothetical protein ZIOFF_023035 [Zingiber officinale]|uniref:DUF4216 domain-containing protein n=1 Tax=Zingiber officinale TaxID=94328 RepID=A0A8J5L9L9_ZINOF|nr:hypothetical protein ZIOFF_023035 [Zingiber officinale]
MDFELSQVDTLASFFFVSPPLVLALCPVSCGAACEAQLGSKMARRVALSTREKWKEEKGRRNRAGRCDEEMNPLFKGDGDGEKSRERKLRRRQQLGSREARCKIGICVSKEDAYEHLMVDGFIKGYTHWVAHGEISCSAYSISSSVPSHDDVDDMEGLVHEAFGVQQHDADYVETRFNQSLRNDDTTIDSTYALDVFTTSGYALGKTIATKFDDETLKKAHQYVLFNCHRVQSYIDEHRQILNLSHSGLPPHQIERMHSESFASWFAKHIEDTNLSQDEPISNHLKSLARGPNFIGIRYEKFISNGFRFHTKEVERKRKTQNCGVIVRATTSSYSSIRDQNPISSELDYYGILQNVIELDYEGGRKVILFECDWVSKGKRLKLDEDGFMLANFTNVKRHNEPYILASQAMQVFYVEDPVDCNWHVIITTDARGHYKMQPMADVDTYLQSCIGNPEDHNDH